MGPADFRPNIHSVYARVRRITDQIFIPCMQGSGGLLTEYSFGVCKGPADFRLNIHSVYARVRRISDRIFIWCMNGFPTEYSFSVYRGQADCEPNSHSVILNIRRYPIIQYASVTSPMTR